MSDTTQSAPMSAYIERGGEQDGEGHRGCRLFACSAPSIGGCRMRHAPEIIEVDDARLGDVLRRVEEKGDLFKPVLTLKQSLPKLGSRALQTSP